MVKIKLHKYIGTCTKLLTDKVSENFVIAHIKDLVTTESKEYKNLKIRVVWDICRFVCPSYKILSNEDYSTATDKHITSLYLRAFEGAFPTAWTLLKETK